MEKINQDIEQQISEVIAIFRRRNITVAVVLGGMLFFGLVNQFYKNESVNLIFGLAWLFLISVLSFTWAFAKCPRCRKMFFVKYFPFGNAFAQKCLHCGIGKRG